MERVRGHLPFNPHEGIGALVWVKVVGVGDSGVGKTCLVKRFCEEKFTPKFHPTVGVDYGFKIHTIEKTDLRVHFWDMAGRVEYYDVRNELYSQTQAVMLVFDVTNRASFQSLEAWNRETLRCSSSFPSVTIIVANKVDQDIERAVSKEEGERWAASHKMEYCETSAATGEGVNEMFDKMLSDVLKVAIAAQDASNTSITKIK